MKRKYHQVFLSLLILTDLVIYPVSTDEKCDQSKNCGTNISRQLCLKRNCCYIESSVRIHQCVQKFRAKTDKYFPEPRPTTKNIVLPPNAIQFSRSLENEVKKLKLTGDNRLSPSQTILITNWIYDYLKMAAEKTSDFHIWEWSYEGIFHATIKRDPNSYDRSVELKTGIVLNVEPSIGYFWNQTKALIIVEYLTLGGDEQSLKKTPKNIVTSRNKKCQRAKEISANATVVSVKAYDYDWKEHPVVLKFSSSKSTEVQLDNEDQKRITCEFLNKSSQTWSSNGCGIVYGKCSCNNSSKFSAMFETKLVPLKRSLKDLSDIQVVEFIMAALASGCLLITLLSLVFVYRRRSKSYTSANSRTKERTVIHIHFVTAMTGLHLTKMLGELLHKEEILCAVAVVFCRYFMVVGGMWVLIESFILHINIISKGLKHTTIGCYKFIAGWVVPAVIAMTTAAVGFSSGAFNENGSSELLSCPKESYCWLSTESNLIWSATGPLIGIFVISFFILGHTVVYVLWLSAQAEVLKPSTKQSQNLHHIWHATKGIIVLFPILGIPWMLDFYVKTSNYRVSTIVRYCHVIMNGLQGIFLFILYCGLSRETKKTFKKVANNSWKQQKPNRSQRSSGLGISIRKKLSRNNLGNDFNLNHQNQGSKFRFKNQQITNRKSYHVSYNGCHKPHSSSSATTSSFLNFKNKRNYSFAPTDHSVLPLSRRFSRDLFGVGHSKTSNKNRIFNHFPEQNMEPGKPKMISYKLDNLCAEQTDMPALTKWRRVSKQDLGRFSAIPEDLRREINKELLVVECQNNSKPHRSNVEPKPAENRETVKVDVHVNDLMMLYSVKKNKPLVYFENKLDKKLNSPYMP